MRKDSSIPNKNKYQQILTTNFERYPLLEVQDLYKFVYQGARGSEHAVVNPVQTLNWLEDEVENLAEGPVEPVIDPISADGRVVRVNLRPYVEEGGSLTALNTAFIQTAKEYKSEEIKLDQFWSLAERMVEEGEFGLSVRVLQSFFAKMKAQRFPAVHHSKAYKTSYNPAYRVIVLDFLTTEIYLG